uniref:Uncharacterized protein n=1 Tax=Chrysotila carterae TaxID=13221 RepID=A0A7S4C6H5_CHRCT|mmetsp:Transcript_49733/g.107720  ORF Transcript_49733/g.107720 Transcript_49733/m.107720 type:complete len:245 (+) Transcript_49733:197-931(+)
MLPCGAPQSKGGRNCLVERGLESFRMKKLVWVFMAAFFSGACASDFKLSSSFSNGGEFPIDNRGDEDNVSPPLKWSGVPKNTESFVLIVDSEPPASSKAKKRKVHWMVYDIPKDITEIREELSGAGSSDVARLGMKDDAGQAPVVVDPMGSIDGWVDPEVKAMQDMIHGALDASYDERNRAKEGSTSFGSTYYRGPSKSGAVITFKLYALSSRLELPRGASKDDVVAALKGKVLGKATLTANVS